MAGLYIHIPFCKQACHYCDFHFSTNHSNTSEMVDAICKEMKMQKKFFDEPIDTIYFGGGTPSLLNENQIIKILNTAFETFNINEHPEITLEANPDDLLRENLEVLFKAGINRLSIGVQSFDNEHLSFINRAHNADEARVAVELARSVGFKNISIDLIYSIPSENHDKWNRDLDIAIAIKPEHISSYCLTIEPKTVFGNWQKTGKLKPLNDEFGAQQFEILVDRLLKNGYEHYEISNFCLPNKYSKHNSAYWFHKPYLGVGPGAHSFDGTQRQFNISNNAKYLKSMKADTIPFEFEILSEKDIINEYLMMTMRTKWGSDLNFLKKKFNYDCIQMQGKYIFDLIKNEKAQIDNNILQLTTAGKLIADEIASNLFIK